MAVVFPHAAAALDYFDDASNNEMISVYYELNGKCRGGAGELTMAWCGLRDLMGRYMTEQRNLCFGKRGQTSADMQWHKCGSDSLR